MRPIPGTRATGFGKSLDPGNCNPIFCVVFEVLFVFEVYERRSGGKSLHRGRRGQYSYRAQEHKDTGTADYELKTSGKLRTLSGPGDRACTE